MSYDHASQARDDAQSATQDDRSLSCVVGISINSGFDRSQEIPDNALVAAYREAMAAVGSSDRSRRAQIEEVLTATPQLQTTPSQSDDESVPSQEEDDDGDMDSNEDETRHA